jgi:hypothetical protein
MMISPSPAALISGNFPFHVLKVAGVWHGASK